MIPTNDEIDNKLMELLNRCEVKSDIKAVRTYIIKLLNKQQKLNQRHVSKQTAKAIDRTK